MVSDPEEMPLEAKLEVEYRTRVAESRRADAAESRLATAEGLVREKLNEGRCGIEWGARAAAFLSEKEGT